METKEQKPADEQKAVPSAKEMSGKSIEYHRNLEDVFELWAKEIGLTPDRLRQVTIDVIRNHGHQARLHEPGDECFKPVYELIVDSITFFFTIEPSTIEMCGYGWEIHGEPEDDYDGGACFLTWVKTPESPRLMRERLLKAMGDYE